MSASGLWIDARRPAALDPEAGASPRGPATLVLLAITGLWTLLAALTKAGDVTLPGLPHAREAVLVSLPLALGLLLALFPPTRRRPLIAAAAWSLLVLAALELVPEVSKHPSLGYGLPALVAAAWVLDRRPAVGIAVIVAVTASFGALEAYLSWPYTRTVDFVLVALWLAGVGRLVFVGRVRGTRWTLGVGLIVAYLGITLAQVLLSTDVHHAFSAYEFTDWFMLALPLVAFSQWERATLDRIQRFLVLAALLAGAYACLRLAIGPTSSERALGLRSAFNLIDNGTKLKLLGSFPNGADLGAWSALVMPLCLAVALGRSGAWRWVAAAAVPLLAVAMIGASMRAGAVAALFASLVVLLLYQVTRAFPVARVGRVALAVVSVAAVAVGGYAIAGGASSRTHSFTALLTFNNSDKSFTAHQYKWRQAIHDLGGHTFGYGVGSAPTGYTPKQTSTTSQLVNFSVDNGYLKIALEQGLAIMVLFVLGLLALLGGLARRAATTRDQPAAVAAIGGAGTLTSLLVIEGSGAFIDGLPALAAWIAIGLGLAYFQVSRQRAPAYEYE